MKFCRLSLFLILLSFIPVTFSNTLELKEAKLIKNLAPRIFSGLFLLGVSGLFIYKKKIIQSKQSELHLVEKKYLNNKTAVYLISLNEQRFLLVDNQHSLALQALNQND